MPAFIGSAWEIRFRANRLLVANAERSYASISRRKGVVRHPRPLPPRLLVPSRPDGAKNPINEDSRRLNRTGDHHVMIRPLVRRFVRFCIRGTQQRPQSIAERWTPFTDLTTRFTIEHCQAVGRGPSIMATLAILSLMSAAEGVRAEPGQ